MKKKERRLPAIPPNDYKGTIAQWIVKLIQHGWWDGVSPDWYGDVQIKESAYDKILKECEK